MHHVLLVEDEPLVLAAASTLLRSAGHSVATAASYAEALSTLERDRRITLVITDVCLGNEEEEGLALAFATSRLRPSARIVILSGKARPPLELCPPNSMFLEKPYDPRLLLAAAEAALPQPAL